MGSGLALSHTGWWFYLFPDTALKACSVRPKLRKEFIAHYIHQKASGFARSLKTWSLDTVCFSVMSVVKRPH